MKSPSRGDILENVSFWGSTWSYASLCWDQAQKMSVFGRISGISHFFQNRTIFQKSVHQDGSNGVSYSVPPVLGLAGELFGTDIYILYKRTLYIFFLYICPKQFPSPNQTGSEPLTYTIRKLLVHWFLENFQNFKKLIRSRDTAEKHDFCLCQYPPMWLAAGVLNPQNDIFTHNSATNVIQDL